jgi:hypothetical protein
MWLNFTVVWAKMIIQSLDLSEAQIVKKLIGHFKYENFR